MSKPKPLQIFVAMPGQYDVKTAKFTTAEAVKKNVLEPVRSRLQNRLHRKVELIVEKEKRRTGMIHQSMFREASDADVYIADLTGANANVYLELGVRWSLRDGVTVLIAQDKDDLRFNVGPARAVIYTPNNISTAIDEIVDAIENGLASNETDSLVRGTLEIVTVEKSKFDRMEAEIRSLKEKSAANLIEVARATEELDKRIAILKKVTAENPSSIDALFELGHACRQASRYDEAVETLKGALNKDRNNVRLLRELGICYGKLNQPDEAVEVLSRAADLDQTHAETYSNLGGALRRLGMINAPASYDKEALRKARGAYQKAHELEPFDLYSSLNVARLDLLLSKWDPKLLDQARSAFKQQINLARHLAAQDSKDKHWRLFDLAEGLLFSGDFTECIKTFEEAIVLIPEQERPDKLRSVLTPLNGYIAAGVLTGELSENVKTIIKTLESTASAGSISKTKEA